MSRRRDRRRTSSSTDPFSAIHNCLQHRQDNPFKHHPKCSIGSPSAMVYHLLKNRTTYQELGGDFLERLEPDRLTRQLVQRLEKLGHDVTLRPKEDAA